MKKSLPFSYFIYLLSGLILLSSCGTSRWNNFNRKKHLNLKSLDEVYGEQNEEVADSPQDETVIWEDPTSNEVENTPTESASFTTEESWTEPQETFETNIEWEEDIQPLEVHETVAEDDPKKNENVREVKIKELRKKLKKDHRWSWVSFIFFLLFLAAIGVLFFILNLANPVAELLYVLSIFGGLFLIVGSVSSFRALKRARELQKIAEKEEDKQYASKMVKKSITLITLYFSFPVILAGLLFFLEA
ncbi:MAG: hypothetical protein MI810_08865 [Flavobacteriales bacterium]|nr:hypothetical protein [Flavobacteriales bacterium]